MTGRTQQMATWTVGQVADLFGVTVRTLHHYDEIGLLVPSERSRAGYRLYTDEDLQRLQQVVVYRRLELPLDEIATLLDGGEGAAEHLRRQRATVMSRLDELHELVVAIDRALEREMSNQPATPEDLKELFGDGFRDEYQQEAQERWGETDAWKQSASRTKGYTKADWEQVKAEMDAVNAAFVAALTSGQPATSEAAMDAAEQHRRHIQDRFYDLDHDFHRGLADMYVADPRFTKTYDDLAPGLAAYVRDAIHANADRHAAAG
ncbi:MAG TPA: MerR family transcriptional regulator [Terrabacter sp.]|nr:MerR family transcriptional regulator [Terrabacter sp.]